MKVYGASVSYSTGKLAAYLRYKGSSCERGSTYTELAEIERHVDVVQHPLVRRADGLSPRS